MAELENHGDNNSDEEQTETFSPTDKNKSDGLFSEAFSSTSRTGRIRKKSAKLIEMENTAGPLLVDDNGLEQRKLASLQLNNNAVTNSNKTTKNFIINNTLNNPNFSGNSSIFKINTPPLQNLGGLNNIVVNNNSNLTNIANLNKLLGNTASLNLIGSNNQQRTGQPQGIKLNLNDLQKITQLQQANQNRGANATNANLNNILLRNLQQQQKLPGGSLLNTNTGIRLNLPSGISQLQIRPNQSNSLNNLKLPHQDPFLANSKNNANLMRIPLSGPAAKNLNLNLINQNINATLNPLQLQQLANLQQKAQLNNRIAMGHQMSGRLSGGQGNLNVGQQQNGILIRNNNTNRTTLQFNANQSFPGGRRSLSNAQKAGHRYNRPGGVSKLGGYSREYLALHGNNLGTGRKAPIINKNEYLLSPTTGQFRNIRTGEYRQSLDDDDPAEKANSFENANGDDDFTVGNLEVDGIVDADSTNQDFLMENQSLAAEILERRRNSTKRKRKKITAYTLWCVNQRKTLPQGLDFGQISRILGDAWNTLHPREKIIWKRRAKKITEKLQAELPPEPLETKDEAKKSNKKSSGKSRKSGAKAEDGASGSDNDYEIQVNGTEIIDSAAHLKLLGESLTHLGELLQDHDGLIAVQGSLSVLLDSLICSLGPLICLTLQITPFSSSQNSNTSHVAFAQQTKDCCGRILDNIAYIMPGL